MNQIDISDYQYFLCCNAKRTKNGPLNFLRKKICISIGNIDSFSYSTLTIIAILSDQGVVQSERE